MHQQTLVVGIGSHHGDDQLGWLVAKKLAGGLGDHCQVRIALTPLDLLDWIDQCHMLYLVDACQGQGQPGMVHRWTWPNAAIRLSRWSGTHDFDLPAVLTLADELGQLPRQVVIWAIERDCYSTQESISSTLVKSIDMVANRILGEIGASDCGRQ